MARKKGALPIAPFEYTVDETWNGNIDVTTGEIPRSGLSNSWRHLAGPDSLAGPILFANAASANGLFLVVENGILRVADLDNPLPRIRSWAMNPAGNLNSTIFSKHPTKVRKPPGLAKPAWPGALARIHA